MVEGKCVSFFFFFFFAIVSQAALFIFKPQLSGREGGGGRTQYIATLFRAMETREQFDLINCRAGAKFQRYIGKLARVRGTSCTARCNRRPAVKGLGNSNKTWVSLKKAKKKKKRRNKMWISVFYMGYMSLLTDKTPIGAWVCDEQSASITSVN